MIYRLGALILVSRSRHLAHHAHALALLGLLLALTLSAAPAAEPARDPPPHPVGAAVVGVWQLVSYTATDPGTGTVNRPFGADAHGLAIYTAGGHMSLLVAGRERDGSARGSLTRSELRAQWLDSMFAYTGTYTVAGDTLTIHIDSAWQPSWVGTVKVRTLKLDHDILTVTTPPMLSPVDGKTYISVTSFKRVE